MKFEIPKVTHFLPLQEYAPEEPTLAGVGIHVWVDPPRSVLMEFDNLNRAFSQVLNELSARIERKPVKKISLQERLLGWISLMGKRGQDSRFSAAAESYRRSMYAWYARLWSQSPDVETHWTVEEIGKINEENPRMYEWLCNSSWVLIEQHRDDVKKGCRGPSVRSPEAERPATPSSLPIT